MIRVIMCLASLIVMTGCTMDSFLFNNEPLDRYDLSTAVIPSDRIEEVTLDSDGNTLYGFYVRQPDSMRIRPHYVVLYNHGNKKSIEEYWDRVELLYRAGFDVFVYDYRGFGRSTGTSSEAGLRADATAAYRFVKQRAADTMRIVTYGFSLGGYPATYQASTFGSDLHIMEACFASGEELVRSGTVLDIPGSYVLQGTFDNVSRMPLIPVPVLILHGEADTYIDIDRHGARLFAAANAPKVMHRVPNGTHAALPTDMGEEAYLDLITSFIRGN
jgi:uncharacterized protein